jgi:hypothetical protein
MRLPGPGRGSDESPLSRHRQRFPPVRHALL